MQGIFPTTKQRYITVINKDDEIISSIDMESDEVIMRNGYRVEFTNQEPLMRVGSGGWVRVHVNSEGS